MSASARDLSVPTGPAAPPPPVEMTAAQREAVTVVGAGVLVSAAAGSGKTRVLAERCAHLVCDAPPGVRCEADELLVVTFTHAAAAEMRGRIERVFRDRQRAALGAGDEGRAAWLGRQVALLGRAQISTLHSFCGQLLRRHFNAAGLDPAFEQLDEAEARLLRRECARRAFDAAYDLPGEGGDQFRRLVDAWGGGDDESLLRDAMKIHDTLDSVVDPAGWARDARARLAEAADRPVGESALGRELLGSLREELDELAARWAEATDLAEGHGLSGYAGHAALHRDAARRWADLAAVGDLDALAADSTSFKPGNLPGARGDPPGKAEAKAAIDALKKHVKEGPLGAVLAFTAAEWRATAAAVAGPTGALLDAAEAFAAEYRAAKDRDRALDFADLERLALRLLTDRDAAGAVVGPSAVARSLHGRYRHVLVDEYQDINALQDAILRHASTESVAGEDGAPPSNLFCVGDVKQSIYRFRLADLEQFKAREARFRAGEKGGTNRRAATCRCGRTSGRAGRCSTC